MKINTWGRDAISQASDLRSLYERMVEHAEDLENEYQAKAIILRASDIYSAHILMIKLAFDRDNDPSQKIALKVFDQRRDMRLIAAFRVKDTESFFWAIDALSTYEIHSQDVAMCEECFTCFLRENRKKSNFCRKECQEEWETRTQVRLEDPGRVAVFYEGQQIC